MKENNDVIKMESSSFIIENNFEEVPYLNNSSDGIQDIIKEIEKNTEDIQNNFIAKDNGNIINISFDRKNDI